MIKVVYIGENNRFSLLQKDKVYLASEVCTGLLYTDQESLYHITNIDTNKKIGPYDKKCFIPLAEIRENQIKKVLDD